MFNVGIFTRTFSRNVRCRTCDRAPAQVGGIFEQAAGVKLDWYKQLDEGMATPLESVVHKARLHEGVNHTAVVELLLAAGASPLAGVVGASPLHLAFEMGMVYGFGFVLVLPSFCGRFYY